MKRQLRRWEIGGILCFALLFIACEPESFNEPKPNNTTRIVSKTLSLDELQYESELMEKLETLLPGFRTEVPDNEERNFTINTETIIYIEKGNQHSYTFSIVRKEVVSGLENLVLNYEQGNYTAYWIRYDFTATQLAHPEDLVSQETRVVITPFDPESSFMSRKRPNPCVTWENKAVGWNDQGQTTHSEWIQVVDQDCMDQLNSGGPTSSSTTSGGGGSNGGGGISNGGWGGWMGTGVNTGVYDPPPATDNSGYTGSGSGGGFGGHSGGSGTSVFTLPNVPKITFANYIKKLKVSLRTIVPNPSWWHTTSGKRIIKYLQQHFDTKTGLIDIKVSEFAIWAIGYLVSHPEVTWEQFENWFMGEVEGNDGGEDFNYGDYSNIQTHTQILPDRNSFYNAFPKEGTAGMESKQVYQLIGGSILDSHLNNDTRNNYQNACALRISRALNYTGRTIPVFYNNQGSQRTQKGGDNLNYILDASSLLAYMLKTFPDNDLLHLKDKTPLELKTTLEGKWGIYIMIPKDRKLFGASGHADFFSYSGCLSGCYFNDAKEIYFWELY